jgi:hypothetical protein
MISDAGSYRTSFDLLRRDLFQVFEYVEPVDGHRSVYSHRLFALLVRACTDFESIAKDLLVAKGSRKAPDKMNVNDYRTLERSLRLETVEARLHLWYPQPLVVFPFRRWSIASPPLAWYADYNAVKHNRHREFARANLETVITATAALLTLVAKASDFDLAESTWSAEPPGFAFFHAYFSIHGPQ